MPPPLSLISLAAAAGGGTIDGNEVRQLVAAGVTMLQRCAPLVRELATGRAALLLPSSAEYLVALAACEGRGAVLLDSAWPAERVERTLELCRARVVFTIDRCARVVPAQIARVLLDELPGHVVFQHGDTLRKVDVGSHFGLSIEGEESEGSDEEAAVALEAHAGGAVELRGFTHRSLLDAARSAANAAGMVESDEVLTLTPFHTASGLAAGLLAPLLAGARVLAVDQSPPTPYASALAKCECTVVVGDAARLGELAVAVRQLERHRTAPRLRAVVAVGDSVPASAADAWENSTGTVLLQAPAPESQPL